MQADIRRRLVVWGMAVTLVGAYGPTVEAQEKKATPPAPTMGKEEMEAFLAKPLIARLALVRANGSPQVTPMWFLYEDGILYMSTRVDRAKVKHIKANPRVAVAIDVMEAPLKNKIVIMEGTAELLPTGVKELTTKIYRKYMGADGSETPQAQQSINAPRVGIKITPKKVETLDTTK
jgi:PPOX class probable F420-dependent enzyme